MDSAIIEGPCYNFIQPRRKKVMELVMRTCGLLLPFGRSEDVYLLNVELLRRWRSSGGPPFFYLSSSRGIKVGCFGGYVKMVRAVVTMVAVMTVMETIRMKTVRGWKKMDMVVGRRW